MTAAPPVSVSAPGLGSRLVDLGQMMARTQHELVTVAAAFAAGDEWLRAGAPTAAHWIADQLQVCVSTAREWIRIGRALLELPIIEEAFATRRLSYAKVRTLTRVATGDTEAELCDLASRIPAGQLGVALAGWTQAREDPAQRHARHQRDRYLIARTQPDGMVWVALRLPPLDAAGVLAAIDAVVARRSRSRGVAIKAHRATGTTLHTQSTTFGDSHASADASRSSTENEHRWPSLAQQRLDALVELCTDGGAGITAEIVVHVRGDGCTLDDGTPVTDTVVERLAPTAFLRALIHDAEGRPINASSRRRHPTTRQKRVVKERDRVCIDCGSPDLLEYDHHPEFGTTGRTVTDELHLRCATCHHRRHEQLRGRYPAGRGLVSPP